jgi:hypothetical protein
MLKIKENEKPNLELIEFLCDKPLHPKLDKYELTKFLNMHTCTAFIGKPKSGKTSLLCSLMKKGAPLFKIWYNVFLFQPSHSRASMKNDIFQYINEDNGQKKFDELNVENLSIVRDALAEIPQEENALIIFDDMTAFLKNDVHVVTLLKDICNNRRHRGHVSLYFLVQTWQSIPKEIRRLITNLFVFKVSIETFNNIFEELLEEYNKKNIKEKLLKLVYDKPHNFLFINTDSQRLFKNWDEIEIT